MNDGYFWEKVFIHGNFSAPLGRAISGTAHVLCPVGANIFKAQALNFFILCFLCSVGGTAITDLPQLKMGLSPDKPIIS